MVMLRVVSTPTEIVATPVGVRILQAITAYVAVQPKLMYAAWKITGMTPQEKEIATYMVGAFKRQIWGGGGESNP